MNEEQTLDDLELLELEPLLSAGLSIEDAQAIMLTVSDKGYDAQQALTMLLGMKETQVRAMNAANHLDEMTPKQLVQARYYNRASRRRSNKKKGLKKLGKHRVI